MTSLDVVRGRLLLWSTAFAAAATFGLPECPPPSRSALLVLVGPFAGAALFVLLAGGRVPRPRLRVRSSPTLAARWAYLAAGAAFEELVWRGLVLAMLAPVIGPVPALVVSSAGFALSHRRSLGGRSIVHLLTGAAFGGAYLAGGLAAAILAHAVYNILVDLAVQSEHARLRGP